MSKTKINLIYQSLYQILIIILPIVTAPYVSRVLGANGIGQYSYSYSVVSYFVIFAMLGINNYGNKLIATEKREQNSLNIAFTNLFLLHAIISLVVIAAYLIYVHLTVSDIKYALICAFYLIGALFDINWLYFGLEEFKITVTRNTVLRIITIILVFIFVKTVEDTWKYILILALGNCLGQIVIWTGVLKRVQFVRPDFCEMKKHIKPLLILFVPVIAVSFYKIMDKIMLNNLANTAQVGLYENAEKIINIPMGLITAVGMVMLPRSGALLSENKNEAVKHSIAITMKYVMILSYALSFGLMAISNDFATAFFGKEFAESGTMIFGLAITIPFMSFANIIRTQYLIPKNYNKIFILSVVFGAIVNLVANWILIPMLMGMGAVIGTIMAELTVFLVQTLYVRKELKSIEYLIHSIPFLICGVVMFIVVRCIANVIDGGILSVLMQVIVGVVIYCICTFVLLVIGKDETLFGLIKK